MMEKNSTSEVTVQTVSRWMMLFTHSDCDDFVRWFRPSTDIVILTFSVYMYSAIWQANIQQDEMSR